jgi:benzoate/toluate 1,2-dioxygenase beta subunit
MARADDRLARVTATEPELLERCAQFVYAEAEHLDALELDQWLAMFDAECIYWLPMLPGQSDAADHLNLVYDDRSRLEDRVSRLRSGFSFAEEPGSRTSHLISNVRLLDPNEAARAAGEHPLETGDVAVAARCIVGRARQGVVQQFHGRTVWVLRPSGDTFAIRLKRIDLLNANDPMTLLTFLL